MFTPVASCFLMITLVYLFLDLFTRVYLYLLVLSSAYHCLLVFIHFTTVNCMFNTTHACYHHYHCLLIINYVYHCYPFLHMFTYDYTCLPMFTRV